MNTLLHTCMSLSVAFFTLRMSLTELVLAACGPPEAMAALMSSLYILQTTDSRITNYPLRTDSQLNIALPSAQPTAV